MIVAEVLTRVDPTPPPPVPSFAGTNLFGLDDRGSLIPLALLGVAAVILGWVGFATRRA